MPETKVVSIDHITPNPHRMLSTYPWNEAKLEQLQRSIDDVGLWEGVIARKNGTRYQLAFGHHRIEAAKRCGLKKVTLIIRDLSDEDMLKFMGRENGEDYSSDFLTMLNTWEGAVEFTAGPRKKFQAIDVARLLGWTQPTKRNADQMNHVARACSNAHSLIQGGYLSRDDLSGLSVNVALDIVSRAHSRMENMQKMAQKTNTPKADVEKAKKHVATGAKATARRVREGSIATKDVRGEVDAQAYKAARSSKQQTPLFAELAKAMSGQLRRILSQDTHAHKLDQIEESIQYLTSDEDEEALESILFELEQLRNRAQRRSTRLKKAKVDVTPIQPELIALTGGEQ